MSRIKAYTGHEPYMFISYAHADTEVQELLHELADRNYRFWYDEGIKSGSDWADEITERIKNCTQFVAILSNNAIKSENVKDEIHMAVKYKIDMLVIHLESIVLDGGLELHLDRKQALLKYTYDSKSEFSSSLCRAINGKTARILEDGTNSAVAQFKEQYDLIDLVASNDFSKTYLATKKGSTNLVLAKHFFQDHPRYDTREIGLDEIRILRMLQNCPFSPFLIEHFEDKHNVIVVKTYVEGEYLDRLKEKFDFRDISAHQDYCVGIALSVAETLLYLHHAPDYPIVHRGIRPANILVNSRGYGIITDYEVCKVLDGFSYNMWGTIGYAAPESRIPSIDNLYRVNDMTDGRSDIYSLGITLLEILTGVHPWDASNFYKDRPLCDYNKGYSLALTRIINKMTATMPDDRYQTIEEVIYDLRHYKEEDAKRENKGIFRKLLKQGEEFRQKWLSFQSDIEKKNEHILSIGSDTIRLLNEGKISGNIELDHEQFLIEEEIRQRGIPEENRLYGTEDESSVSFVMPSYIRNNCPFILEFEISNLYNIKTLCVGLNGSFKTYLSSASKSIDAKNGRISVRFDAVPTLLDLSRDETLFRINKVEFVCDPECLIDQKKPAHLTITNVTIRKA